MDYNTLHFQWKFNQKSQKMKINILTKKAVEDLVSNKVAQETALIVRELDKLRNKVIDLEIILRGQKWKR